MKRSLGPQRVCAILAPRLLNVSYSYNYMSIQSAPLMAVTLYLRLPEPKRTLGGRLGVLFHEKGTEARGDRVS